MSWRPSHGPLISRRRVVALLAAALLLSLAAAYGNRGALLAKLEANPKTCTLSRLEFPPVGPRLALPAEGDGVAVLQEFVSRHTTLSGIEVGLFPLTDAALVSGTLTLFDDRGAVVRTERFRREQFAGGLLRVPFAPVQHRAGARFAFSLVADAALAGQVAVQASRPTRYSEGSLSIDGEEQPLSLFHRTVHPTRWQVRSLVDALEFARVPYFLGVAIAGVLAYGFVSYRALYLVLVLTSVYTAFAFMPYSKVDEEAHFDYVNHLSAHRSLPLVEQRYAADDLDALTGEVGNLDWNDYLWFDKRYEAVHPPLYYATAAALARLAGSFTDSPAVRFFSLRLLGAALLLAAAVVIGRTYELLVSRSVLARHDLLLFATAAVFLLSPGFQATLIPVTNDQLTAPLMSLHLYLLAKLWFRDRVAARDVLLLSAVSGLLLLTRTTTAHVVPLVVVFLIAKRAPAAAAGYLLGTAALLLPWLAFNQRHYGLLLANPENVKIASRALDMSFTLSPGALASVAGRFVRDFLLSHDRTFLLPQEGTLATLATTAWKSLVWSAVAAYGWALLRRSTGFVRARHAAPLPADVRWGLFCLLAIVLKFLLLAGASWTYGFDSFYPRHACMDVLALVFMLLVMAQRLGAWARGAAGARAAPG